MADLNEIELGRPGKYWLDLRDIWHKSNAPNIPQIRAKYPATLHKGAKPAKEVFITNYW